MPYKAKLGAMTGLPQGSTGGSPWLPIVTKSSIGLQGSLDVTLLPASFCRLLGELVESVRSVHSEE